MNRREVLTRLSACAALVTSARRAWAGNAVASRAAELYARAIVFDANLSPPLQVTFPFPAQMLDLVRQSGVTAVKTSLGGFNDGFAETVEAIAALQRVFENYPDVYVQVRAHADFAAAKRQKRLGVILSFESVVMLEDKLERIELFRGLGVA